MDEQRTSRQVIGSRIRERREMAGISQGDLAKRAFVARQTVNNWETGKTLIDVQSLALVAEALGTTAGELLGEKGAEAARAEADLRHRLIVLLVGYGLLTLLWVALVVTGAALSNSGAETASLVLSAAELCPLVAVNACWFGLWNLMKEHCVLPHWRVWELLLWVPLVIMYVTVLLSSAA